MAPNANKTVDLLRAMLRIRRVEETIADVYPQGVIRTPTHLSIGQEAIAVGVCSRLRKTDQIFSGHRCHAHYLAKGGDLRRFVAELYGRESGCSRGRGGSVHLIDTSAGMMGSSAILGGSTALALGAALAFQYDKRDLIAVAFLGDAVFEEGIIWECFNVAVLHKLPILFVCENNRYSTNTHYSRRQPPIPIHQRVEGMGVPSVFVDGNDVIVVAECAGRMIDECRRGGGPQMIEAETYRIREHVGPLFDYQLGIRSKEEVKAWIAKCPVKRLREQLISCGALSEIELGEMESEVRREIEDAFSFAQSSSWPEPGGLHDFTY